MNQTIAELTAQEQSWIAEQLQEAERFVIKFSPDDCGNPRSLPAADRALKAWLTTDPTDVPFVNGVVNAVGMLFGQALVDGAGLRWVIAADDRGTDLAVFGLPGAGDVLIYPANFVAKRWERRETDFLQSAVTEISAEVHLLETQRGAKNGKPWWKFW